ncbi:MAG: TonB-dependent receptor plug domain-containing protein [Bacteroidetes bacterium]|nr:TonB-dependent receptor plug domain-containing protein [Bacteroidota bacterium]
MKVCVSVLSILIFQLESYSQKFTISGYLKDKKTSERLAGASIALPQYNIGTASNNFGFYSVTVPYRGDSLIIELSYSGYEKVRDTIFISNGQSIQKDFSLSSKGDLQAVVVTAQRLQKIETSSQMSSISMPIELIKKMPSFLGEPDVMKALQFLPGVQGGNEGQTGIYVRGGGPDQNLILLDGVPVYNASHVYGFFSVFNTDAISSVELYKGGFPARFGGRLSSIVDIRMKEGAKTKGVHGTASLGLVSSKFMLEGALGNKNKGSWLVSARRSYIDAILTPLSKLNSGGTNSNGYYFWDLNVKTNYELGVKDHIYLSAYMGKDKFFDKGFENKKQVFSANIDWGNITGMARWNHQFGNKVFGNLSATYSQYQFNVANSMLAKDSTGQLNSFSSLNRSKIRDFGLKYDLDIYNNPYHTIKMGAGVTFHTFTPNAVALKSSSLPSVNTDTTFNVSQVPEIDSYIEDDISFSKKLKANIGVHFSGFKTPNHFYTSLQPRVSVRYLIKPTWSIKASYSNMAQYIELLSNSSVGLPTDLWVPITDKIKPQTSDQFALGVAHTTDKGYEFSVEAYYKTMKNVIEYKDGTSYLNKNQSWEDMVEMGKGWSYGLETFFQKKYGRLTGLVGYTLSFNNRKFPTINEGRVFPYKYDRRHDFKIAVLYKLRKNIDLSANWVFETGNSISMPDYQYSSPVGIQGIYDWSTYIGYIFHYGSRNNYRMPSYHRLDLAVNFHKTTKRGFERTWTFGLYNAYNRANPYFIYPSNNSNGHTIFVQESLFPIIPSIGYSLKF